MQSGPERLEFHLARRLSQGDDAVRLADAVAAVWHAIDAALSPVLGARGVAALFQRGVHQARAALPWLDAACRERDAPIDFSVFRDVLALQAPAQVLLASASVLHAFCSLLDRLIGASLTERLLQPVWDRPSSGHAAQDH
jgi:hypothetical protein